MNEDSIRTIESELSVQLPQRYRDFMLNYPLSGTDNEGWELCDDASILVKHNKELRSTGFFGVPWPDHFYVLGSDGCGNFYFINLESPDSKVYLADHESLFDPNDLEAIQESYPNLDSFASFLAEIAEESDPDDNRSMSKRWWEFWK